ncbi:MAG: ATP synthase F0 subunit B [Actinomycetia bacterium]|nr:ATP synthase F0 subunit B [Actinomycetes bacterium]
MKPNHDSDAAPPDPAAPVAGNGSGPAPSGHQDPRLEAILARIHELIDQARPMPLSASAMINREEVLGLVNDALGSLPEELRAARWLLKERDEFLGRVRREGDEILGAARTRAEQMVRRGEVVKLAEQRASRIVDEAEATARRMRRETEDFCDQRLASFEIVLERTAATVRGGREKLQGTAGRSFEPEPEVPAPEPEAGPEDLFDQDAG